MKRIYAAYHKEPEEIEKSSSGAMFVAISDEILRQKGIVVGAVYDYKLGELEHKICRTAEERDACRGSKYFQSRIGKNIYEEIVRELENEIPVLFVGTPCQVMAVKRYVYLKRGNDNSLLTCDIVCHGVGSYGVWRSFCNWKRKEFSFLTFKDKKKGWLHPRCVAKAQNKKVSLRGYSWLYFSNAIMRPVCYECCFANAERVGDFTIGDFWKVKTKVPEIFNSRGTSFLMVNTDKAELFFDLIKSDLVYKKVEIEDVMQNNMQHPTKKPNCRAEVMEDFTHKNSGRFFKKWEIKILIDKLKQKLDK